MAILPGTRIGVFEVTEQLGAGGMGVVYRARDTKLHRDIALKLLPEHFAEDPDRAARLEREAQVLASLNHPHIAHVYGLEQADGFNCIVMELIEGPTLADRIAAAPSGLPPETAINIAQQLVSALEAAHGRGIVHRDLKPANIKLTAEGQVKVLDFGLATAGATSALGVGGINVTNSPTVMNTSIPGVAMGTLAYMSPEQTRGTAVDSRTDVSAFGCVLYEMLTGRNVFAGETPTDVVAKIITTSPDWTNLPPQTPTSLRHLLRAALDKDLKKRLQHISDARFFLEPSDDVPSATSTHPPSQFGYWAAAMASVFAVAFASVSFVHFRETPPIAPPMQRLEMPMPNANLDGGLLSPDGSQVLFFEARGRGSLATSARPVCSTPEFTRCASAPGNRGRDRRSVLVS